MMLDDRSTPTFMEDKQANGQPVSSIDTNPLSGPLNSCSPEVTKTPLTGDSMISEVLEAEQPRASIGVAIHHLNVDGSAGPGDFQQTVGNIFLSAFDSLRQSIRKEKPRRRILNEIDGLLLPGEMVLVLGRPGSGCSTLLKTISGDTHGLSIESEASLNYNGVSVKQMFHLFRGEAIYMAENDVHFPQLTVRETLSFAARARSPPINHPPGITRRMYADQLRDSVAASFGLSHVMETNVGNDLVPGVSGGERKRVSIAEAALSGSPIQCWDNSTRGLDSSNAISFCEVLKTSARSAKSTICVAIYQAPERAYQLFDKVTVLYEGHQIYFGSSLDATDYFKRLGFQPKRRQTTADFLTALTNPAEREQLIHPEHMDKVPRTAADFVDAWKNSPEYAALIREIKAYQKDHPFDGEGLKKVTNMIAARRRSTVVKSPFMLSLPQQVSLCVERGFQRLKRDASITITGIIVNSIMALVVGSVFYNLPETTSSFYGRCALLFFAILLNAFASALEILTLYAQRPIVEKQSRYAFYRPVAEGISSSICDLPYKIGNAIFFNLTLYFMTNLRRTPQAFFTFLLFSFMTTMVMSMLFRTMGAMSRTLAQALCPSAIIILGLMIYTGFVVPVKSMVPWFRWINYIDPIAYAFESLIINEFSGRNFTCSEFVPFYKVTGLNRVCNTVGASPGSSVVSGDEYIRLTFSYEKGHKWRNFAVIVAFFVLFTITYLIAAETITARKSKGEILTFPRGKLHQTRLQNPDLEKQNTNNLASQESVDTKSEAEPSGLAKQNSVLLWKDLSLELTVKKKTRKILDGVSGWIKPGTMTALMGPSGAGKTTLLNVLSDRNTIGNISGSITMNGNALDASYQRKIGYAQQQDVHLETSTVREALRFSATLRQPGSQTKASKYAYVEEIIRVIGMESYADAVIGVPGESLNIEQRKRLTIAVELAAKPQLGLFVDEPTSGLDSQTSWAVLDLLKSLTRHGQTVLTTIHQPSTTLFETFDQVLFLDGSGRTVYFGPIGPRAATIIGYFERNGAKSCPPESNPAEWIMDTIGCLPGAQTETDIDWNATWRDSSELALLKKEVEDLSVAFRIPPSHEDEKDYAAPFGVQLWECLVRINKQYWRTPSYIWSKIALTLLTGLFLGFTFYKPGTTLQALQNQSYAVFMLLTLFPNFVPQMLPIFLVQRSIHETRESPSKTTSWPAFLLSSILTELLYNTLASLLLYLPFSLPIFSPFPTQQRSALLFALTWTFLLFTSTFAHMAIAALDTAEAAGNLASALFSFSLIFCGVLATPDVLPRFWIFMYRVSPFTYLVQALLAVGLAGKTVQCAAEELKRFETPAANATITCGKYMAAYMRERGGYLVDANARGECEYCALKSTDAFLEAVGAKLADWGRNMGILWVYVVVNVVAAGLLYWLVRVPRKRRVS